MADDDATPGDLKIRVYPDSVLRNRAATVVREALRALEEKAVGGG